jgi:hypothetical protein
VTVEVTADGAQQVALSANMGQLSLAHRLDRQAAGDGRVPGAEGHQAEAACAGVGVLFFQLRALTRQIKLQHFADYTTRHQRIVLGLPPDIDAPGFTLTDRPDYDRTLQRMRAYFDLSFEKWYLNRRHQIDADIWSIWKDGITKALSKPAFQQAWTLVQAEAKFGADFESFVDQCINYPGSRLIA